MSTPATLNLNLSRKQLQNTSLSPTELSVILGGLLGDGSLRIHSGYKNARYAFRHSIINKEYFLSKTRQLRGLSSPGSTIVQPPDGWSSRKKLRFCTRALPSLTRVHSMTCKDNKLLIKRKWLNHCTALSLAIWWFDDGSLVGGGRQGCLSSDGFPEKECRILAKYLQVVWGVRARVHPITGNKKRRGKSLSSPYHRLYFSTNQLKIFLDIILPYCPCPELIYKYALRYADPHYQERWISHMEEKLPPALRPLVRSHLRKASGGEVSDDLSGIEGVIDSLKKEKELPPHFQQRICHPLRGKAQGRVRE